MNVRLCFVYLLFGGRSFGLGLSACGLFIVVWCSVLLLCVRSVDLCLFGVGWLCPGLCVRVCVCFVVKFVTLLGVRSVLFDYLCLFACRVVRVACLFGSVWCVSFVVIGSFWVCYIVCLFLCFLLLVW